MIVAPKDYYLLSVDLSQAEAWVVAFLANEYRMKQALMYGDIHSQTARGLFDIPENSPVPTDQRYLGKRFNHACNYRMGPDRAAQVINKDSDKPPYVMVTISQTRKLHAKWNAYYSLQGWWSDIERKLQIDRTLTTPYGRRRRFYRELGMELYKEATAFIPQSTIADHMFGKVQTELGVKGGLLGIYNNIIVPSKGEIRITNTSHDSAILEVPKPIINEITARCIQEIRRPLVINGETVTIPADAEIGERWGELEKVDLKEMAA